MSYDAFISYRHAELDLYIAKKLHKKLETFRVPRAVARRSGKKKIQRVFRDQEELPIGSDLGENIEAALAQSEFLLVVCSPRTPQSYWVQKEISTFIEMHGREHVLAVLIEGEPEESFPEQLLRDEEGNPVEPLAADVRGASQRERNRKFKGELLRLAAPLLHCSYDDLRQRHQRRRMRQAGAAAAGVAACGLLFGVYNAYNAAVIQENYEEKQRNQSRYLAETSLRLLEEGDRRAAVLVALEALPSPENDRPYEPEAQYALSQALHCYETPGVMAMDRVLAHELPVLAFNLSEDGEQAVSIDEGGYVYVWDVTKGERLALIPPEVDEGNHVVYTHEARLFGNHIIICTGGGVKSVAFDGQEEWSIRFSATDCELYEEEALVVCGNSELIGFVDARSGESLGSIKKAEGISFAGARACNADCSLFAVALTGKEASAEEHIAIFDRETGEVTFAGATGETVLDLIFTREDHLLATSFGGDGESGGYRSYLEKIDRDTGEFLWQRSMESAGAARMDYRYYEEETGQAHDEIVMRVDDRLYSFDSLSGEELSQSRASSPIIDFQPAKSRSSVFILEGNGNIHAVDMTGGAYLEESEIRVGEGSTKMAVKNGVILVQHTHSSYLTVVKAPEATGWREVTEYASVITRLDTSPEESYYAVYVYDVLGSGEEKLWFYRTEDHGLLGEFCVKNVQDTGFLEDGWYFITTYDGDVIFYQVETRERKELSIGEGKIGYWDCTWNHARTRALLYCMGWHGLVDLENRELLFVRENSQDMNGCVLSADGRRAYCGTEKGGVYCLDLESEAMIPVEQEGYQVLKAYDAGTLFAISPDGEKLAVCCRDNSVRVLDVEHMETLAEIPFNGLIRRFLLFSQDSGRLMMQGDDYYFRVYDLEKGEFSYVSGEVFTRIQDADVDRDSGTVMLKGLSSLIFLDGETLRRSGQITNGLACFPKYGRALVGGRRLYEAPYLTLDMLLEEAERQFGNKGLTEPERARFHVE